MSFGDVTLKVLLGPLKPIKGPNGPGQFELIGEGNLQKAAVVKKGEFVNRAYDSRFGQPGAKVSGPKGESFSPGSGVPTTASEAIERRGLDKYFTNNAQEAIVFQSEKNFPAQARTALEGVDPELLVKPEYYPLLKEMRRYPITNGIEIKPQ